MNTKHDAREEKFLNRTVTIRQAIGEAIFFICLMVTIILACYL